MAATAAPSGTDPSPPAKPSSFTGFKSYPATNDPDKTGYDPSAHWSNVFNILTGRMTPTGRDFFREAKDARLETEDIARAEKWRDWLFSYSPIIRYLSTNISDLNGDLGPHNVYCRRCPTRLEAQLVPDAKEPSGVREEVRAHRQGGGFDPNAGILICANHMRSQSHLEDTLAHEMVHAWDHLRFRVDWSDLRHAACTEIRASMLSGECRWTREFFTRGNWRLTQQFQECVRRRAVQSVMARPFCRDEDTAKRAVDGVWESCFADTRPFDEVYK